MKKKPNGYRYFYHLTGCLFGIFILAVLIINFLVPDRGFSQKENRVLASVRLSAFHSSHPANLLTVMKPM